MKVITFYSYKGGVGRSLAAANFSVYLAKMGLKTVLIDFDLEAPGIDAKFPSLKMSKNQRGILDYILEYQQNNENPGNIQKFTLKVPSSASDSAPLLWLIPSGQYLSEDYYEKLNQLDWGLIFSDQRDGIAFFQQFLAKIHEELQADYVVIDSRTGITEIAGLCTQQLADEVVMLSSLSSESVKVTKHIKNLIKKSTIATALEKSVDIKIVVSRVPKPKDIEDFKQQCCEHFAIDEAKLFFIFSSPSLEREEFLAISSPDKDEELVNNYVRLFYGLDVLVADKNIRLAIEKTINSLL
jgi:MinD-like ATPase involved in chromosome partitioning or flagellar assembly